MNETHSSKASATVTQHVRPVKCPDPIEPLAVPTREQLRERILWWTQPDSNGCWIWTGTITQGGYGRIKVRASGEAKSEMAHRLSYRMFVGEIPEGMCVCHRCDVRACCNPDHLWLGTTADNIADRDQKGRTSKGDKHWTRLRPEGLATGDDHWTRRYPEKVARGDNNGLRKHPHRAARGDRNGSRLHPELLNPPRGEDNGSSKLTEAQVREIRKIYSEGVLTQREIAANYGVVQALISLVVRQKIWAHIQ